MEIPNLVKKIKSFVSDLENNKYTVSKFNPNQSQSESPVNTPPWVKGNNLKPAKVEEPQ